MGPRALRFFLRLLLKLYFREVRVLGLERVPAEGPLLVLSNHVNSLLDPLVLACVLPRPPRFLAKAPLFRHPLVAPFLRAMRALPVYRRADGEGDTARNAATFEACEHALLDGDCIALFPEGVSHSEPRLQPLRTGAARITGRAFRKGAAVVVVPVGLHFSARAVFRSEVVAVAGSAVPYRDLAWGEGDAPGAVRAFTARVAEALGAVTVNADRWEDLQQVEALRPLALEAAGVAPETVDPLEVRGALLQRFYEARLERPAEVAALLHTARRYARWLRALALRDEDVARGEIPAGRALRYAAGRFAALAAGYPPALYGRAFHLVPYVLTGLAGRLLARTEDTASTFKIYAGLLFYPASYALQLALAAQALGPWWAAAAGAAAVPCGLWALRYYERREAFVRAAWAFLALRTRTRLATHLEGLRAELLCALRPLAALYR